jgi:hypothetical protein
MTNNTKGLDYKIWYWTKRITVFIEEIQYKIGKFLIKGDEK